MIGGAAELGQAMILTTRWAVHGSTCSMTGMFQYPRQGGAHLWLLAVARWSGVLPRESLTSGSGLLSSAMATSSPSPYWAAQWQSTLPPCWQTNTTYMQRGTTAGCMPAYCTMHEYHMRTVLPLSGLASPASFPSASLMS